MTPWDLYFASLCAWLLHPGYCRDGAVRPSIEDCARMASEMLKEREKWQSGQE